MNGILLANCSIGDIWCIVKIDSLIITLILGVVFFIVLAPPVIADVVIGTFKYSLPRIVKFFKTASPENIQIYLDSNYPRRKNEIILAVENDEWRFNSLTTTADVLLLRVNPDENKERWKNYNPVGKWNHLKWITAGNSDPITLHRWQSAETEFIKIDDSAKEFYVDSDDPNPIKLGVGNYQFVLKIVMLEEKLHVRDNLPSRYRLYRAYSITVKYNGKNLTIEEKRDATNDEATF